MPQDLTGWLVVLAALALGFALGRAPGRSAAQRDTLLGPPAVQAQPGSRPTPEVLAAVQAALASGHTIEAIRILRQATGMGLKEAKQAVERMPRG